MTFRLGRRAPHDVAAHPRLRFAGLFGGTYPPAPPVVDYTGAVNAWPMYLNDQVGDCTVAAAGHMIEAWTRYGTGTTVKITDADVLATYETVGGYRPGHPDTDQGAVMQDVLDYWRKTGIGGHKILAFAEVDVHNTAELAAALALFGHVYLGINFPAVAMDQFNAGQPWDVVDNDGGIEGGHAINWGYAATGQNHRIVTWGFVQQMTPAFFARYAEEAWVVVDQEWLSANGLNPEGLDVAKLGEAFTAMTGEPSPFQPPPVPPQPTPGPGPVVDPDRALVAALGGWLRQRHIGANATAVKAVEAWAVGKGIPLPDSGVTVTAQDIPRLIQIRRSHDRFDLLIDGEEFPFWVSGTDPVETVMRLGASLSELRLTLMADRIEVIDAPVADQQALRARLEASRWRSTRSGSSTSPTADQ